MSLAVVGSTALVGALLHHRKGSVSWRTGAVFAASGIVSAYLGSKLTRLVSPPVLMLLFAGLMLVVATVMLTRRSPAADAPAHTPNLPREALAGLGVGFLTGFLGVGGGFLIVPALVVFGGLGMKAAIGTSLFVIAVNCAAGLAGHLTAGGLDWKLTALVTALAVGGALAGTPSVGPIPPEGPAPDLRLVRRGGGSLSDRPELQCRPLNAEGDVLQAVLPGLSRAGLLPDRVGRRGGGRRSAPRRRRLPRGGERAQGLHDPARDRDAPPRGLRLGPPRARGDARARRSTSARRPAAAFAHVPVRDGDEIRIGKVTLRFLETPGHTPESVSIVVTDHAKSDAPEAVLTGDTLFIGDVGRPDLLGARMSAEELAGMLYDSLHGKLLKLPDSVKVYPAHGAGSLCGRNISSETSSTIGEQRRFNYALRPMPREEFVRLMTTDLPEAPAYFSRDAALNRRGGGQLSASSRRRRRSRPRRSRRARARGRDPPRHAARRRVRRPRTSRARCTSASRVSSRRGPARWCRRETPARAGGRGPRATSPRRGRGWRAWAWRTSRAISTGECGRGRPRAGRSRAPSRSPWTSCASACAKTRSSSSPTCAGPRSGARATSRGPSRCP